MSDNPMFQALGLITMFIAGAAAIEYKFPNHLTHTQRTALLENDQTTITPSNVTYVYVPVYEDRPRRRRRSGGIFQPWPY
jgi:hypothetical protein